MGTLGHRTVPVLPLVPPTRSDFTKSHVRGTSSTKLKSLVRLWTLVSTVPRHNYAVRSTYYVVIRCGMCNVPFLMWYRSRPHGRPASLTGPPFFQALHSKRYQKKLLHELFIIPAESLIAHGTGIFRSASAQAPFPHFRRGMGPSPASRVSGLVRDAAEFLPFQFVLLTLLVSRPALSLSSAFGVTSFFLRGPRFDASRLKTSLDR